nr:transposase family protein [Streptomyces mutabilis]
MAEPGPLWHERHQARPASGLRKRAIGAGAKHRLVFVDRLPATLVHLRHGTTHDVLACWFEMDRSTITRGTPCTRPSSTDTTGTSRAEMTSPPCTTPRRSRSACM